jgi:thiosulfate dehydrogenase (quinone) large subunit
MSKQLPEPLLARILFADTRMAWLWLIVRVYVGWIWLNAGWEKLQSTAWIGPKAGAAIHGFVSGALKKTTGDHPDVSGWYANFLSNVVDKNAELFSYLIAYGEVAVGIALILGLFTGIAAFAGSFMNMNFLFAGAVSVNPLLFLLQLFLILAWRIAGWFGIDRYLLPLLGVPWKPGRLFR